MLQAGSREDKRYRAMTKLLADIQREDAGNIGHVIGETDNRHYAMVDEDVWQEWLGRIIFLLGDLP